MAGIGLSTPVHYGLIDHSGEKTSINVHFEAIEDDGSNVAGLFANATGKLDLLKAAILGVTNGNFTRTTAQVVAEVSSPSLPSDENAQREIAIRVTYADTVTGKTYRLDLPTADSALRQQGTDDVNLADAGAMAAFKTAFELYIVSELGNPVVIQKARFVGKNT